MSLEVFDIQIETETPFGKHKVCREVVSKNLIDHKIRSFRTILENRCQSLTLKQADEVDTLVKVHFDLDNTSLDETKNILKTIKEVVSDGSYLDFVFNIFNHY